MTDRTRKLMVGAAGLALAAGLAGGGVALAGGGDDDGPRVTGPEADSATIAALAATGGGKANSVERDSEDGAVWEVEVTRPDGVTVDVRLDGSYQVVVIEGDTESEHGSEDDGDSGDDEGAEGAAAEN